MRAHELAHIPPAGAVEANLQDFTNAQSKLRLGTFCLFTFFRRRDAWGGIGLGGHCFLFHRWAIRLKLPFGPLDAGRVAIRRDQPEVYAASFAFTASRAFSNKSCGK
jgi:hypothetical protein